MKNFDREENAKFLNMGRIFHTEYFTMIREERYYFPCIDRVRKKKGRKGIMMGTGHLERIIEYLKEGKRNEVMSWRRFSKRYPQYKLIENFEKNSPLIYRGR